MDAFTLGFESLSLLASLALFFEQGVPRSLKYFPPFLLITVLVEIAGFELSKRGMSNVLLYSLFTTFEFVFYLLVLRSIIQSKKAKRIIQFIIWAYPVLALFNISFIQVHTFHSITYSLGCLIIVGVCVFYFLELFRLSKSVNLLRQPGFWISSGLLFFYTCGFPLVGMVNFLHGLNYVVMREIGFVLTLLNILLYSLFSIAFLCRLGMRKSNQ